MTSRPLDTQIHDPDAGDEFLLLLLGAEATLRRVDRLLLRRHPTPVRLPPDDAVLSMALGWVSLRRTLARWLGEAARRPAPEAPGSAGATCGADPEPAPAAGARRRAGLLR
jgi:hypothetical protein